MSIKWNATSLKRGLQVYRVQVEGKPMEIAKHYAPQAERDMKQGAPWTDRTGNARQSLWGAAQPMGPGIAAIVLKHGVEYGIFLEYGRNGRYAVVIPTTDFYAARIKREVGFR